MINKYHGCKVQHDDIVNTVVIYMKVVKRVNPKSSQHKEKNIFCFFFLLYLYEMMDAN